MKLFFLAQMNREEKHRLVIKLYNEGKPMREIAKEVHMSFGDIGSITRKINEDSEPKSKEKSQECQALKLFRNGKNPVDVAITLDISPSKAEGIYKEFWKLRGLYKLHDLYEMVKHDISLLVKVHDSVKKYDFGKKDIINIVNFADEYRFLEQEIQDLGTQFKNLLKERHDVNDSLQSAKKELERVTDEIDTYNEISEQKNTCINTLNKEIENLESCISQLKNSDEFYSKFEKFAEDKLHSIMKDHRWLLSMALDAVIESLMKDSENKFEFNDLMLDKIDRHKQLDLTEHLFDKLLRELIQGTFMLNENQVTTPPINKLDKIEFDQSDIKHGEILDVTKNEE